MTDIVWSNITVTLGQLQPWERNQKSISKSHAKRLLASSDLPVTAILFDVGFQTKSNFNREFLRVTGMTPSDYRRSGARPSADGPSAAEAPSPETR